MSSQEKERNSNIRFTFSKEERLCSKKIIEELFRSKLSTFHHPFKILYLKEVGFVGKPQLLVSVPKRNFKRAVDRNILKRVIKESYRLQKPELLQQEYFRDIKALAIVYIAKEIISYSEIDKKLKISLLRLNTD